MYTRTVRPYFFAGALAMWAAYSGYRLIRALRKGMGPGEAGSSQSAEYWVGALAASVIVPVVWMVVASTIRIF